MEHKLLMAENTLEFINDQISIIQDSLHKTEKQILSFRLNKNVVDINLEGNRAYSKLLKFYDQKTELNFKQNYYEYLKEYIISKHDPQAIIVPILFDPNNQTLNNQVKYLQQLYNERDLLEFSVETGNPGLVRINQSIQTARNNILEITDGLLQNNRTTLKQIDAEEKQIENQLLHLPQDEQELMNYQRKFEVNNLFYTFLMEKRAEAGIQRASAVSNVRIIDLATIYNVTPMGTKSSSIYLIALILGVIIPGGIIFLADAFDSSIKDRSDIEENTDIPILGVVSHNSTREAIPVHIRPGDAFAESFRHIRTNLQYILREPEQKVIMITSTLSGEGKTFIALNLATILAMSNKKVLLCGFDLRRPSLHKVFNLDNSKGISTFLAKRETSIEEIISTTDIENLDVMIAGPVPPNPAELLETTLLSDLINKVSSIYDFVVLDTPPVALVTDAILISKYSDSNMFIIRQNFSPKGILDIINDLQNKQVKKLSLMVNDIKESKAFGYRYYYGYGYRYSYHQNYGDKYYNNDLSRK